MDNLLKLTIKDLNRWFKVPHYILLFLFFFDTYYLLYNKYKGRVNSPSQDNARSKIRLAWEGFGEGKEKNKLNNRTFDQRFLNFELTPMIKTYLITCSLLLLLAVTGCNKHCEQNQVINLRFTDNELKINPYSGEETLIFKTTDEDSIAFYSGIRMVDTYRSYTYDYETAKIYHDGCQGDFFQAESNNLIKEDSINPNYLSITLRFCYELKKPNSEKEFGLFFYIKAPQLLCFNAIYNFQEDTLIQYRPYSVNYPRRDSIVSYNPVITIGQKEFYNVYELYSRNPDPRDTAWISIAYYNFVDGLVGFKSSYGQTWYLYKKSI
jgi:hypothetical protein